MNRISVQLVRHATLLMFINNLKLLIDPMLSDRGDLDPVQNCGNDIRFPLVDLPFNKSELTAQLNDIDAVFATHLHRDHWDIAAQQLIDKEKQIFCQPEDCEKIREHGFINVTPIEDEIEWNKIKISRTKGRHGTGEIGTQMGKVSGFVFSFQNRSIYVAGDTIWCKEVEEALSKFNPEATIVNAGGAQFLTGDPITMTPNDIFKVHKALLKTKIIAVHMDTVNHCLVKRVDLMKALTDRKVNFKVIIPQDGEVVEIK